MVSEGRPSVAMDSDVRRSEVDRGSALPEAVETVLADILALGGRGGIIATGPDGEAIWRFTTPGMNRASLRSDGERRIAIFGDE